MMLMIVCEVREVRQVQKCANMYRVLMNDDGHCFVLRVIIVLNMATQVHGVVCLRVIVAVSM